MIKAIGHCVFKSLVILALIVSVSVLLKDFVTPEVDPAAVRQNSGNTVLFDHKDECWTQGPAKAEIPTHVIMRINDEPWKYKGGKWVDIALADVLTKDNPRVHVIAFCV